MINSKLSFIALLLLADCFLCDDIFATLCGRILFKQPQNSDEFLYKEVINGIYIKTNKLVDNFPLYVNERGSIYFQYFKNVNAFYFIKSLPRQSVSLGLGAEADITKMNDPKSWVKMADQKYNIFEGVVTKWFQYSINKNVYLKENLTITCSNSTDCLFRDLTFSYKNKDLNDPLKDYFTPVDNLYSFNRQVYRHSKFNVSSWYLYYFDSFWIIGSNITSGLAYWAVIDHALKPEFITNIWKKNNGILWEEQVGVTFQCRGSNKPCSDDRCTMNGVCSLNQYNKSTCTCFFSYTGEDCSKSSVTCESDVEVTNVEAGSIRANFCLSTDSFYDVQCARTASGYYAWTSKESCKIPITAARTATTASPTTTSTTTTTTTTTTTGTAKVIRGKVFNIDDFTWTSFMAIIGPAIIPLFVPLIVKCIKRDSNDWRILSLTWYFSMVILLCLKSVAAIFRLQIYGPLFFYLMDIMIAILVPIFYLYILIESQFCDENKYVNTMNEGEEIDRYLNLIYETEPQVLIVIRCFHLETKTRDVSYFTPGGLIYAEETYQEEVTSYTDTKRFSFRTWRDVSDCCQVPSTRNKFTLVNLSAKLSFADDQTYEEFSNVESNLIESNKNRDTNIISHTILSINGFKSFVRDVDSNRPFWMSSGYFQIANFLALSWPYRWLLGCFAQTLKHSICKEISIIENLPPIISLTEGVNYTNESFQSEQIGVQPYPGVYSRDQHNVLCTNPTFLGDSGIMEPVTPPPYYFEL